MSTSIFDPDAGYDTLTETEPDCPQSLSSREISESDDPNVICSGDQAFDRAKT